MNIFKIKAFFLLSACILTLHLAILAASVEGQQIVTPTTDQQETFANKIFQELINEKKHVGMVVGVIDGKQKKIFSYGKTGMRGSQRLDGHSVFEIGSVNKPFTGILLADMVERGEVSFSDPVKLYLPESVKMPKYKEKEITLLDLATQSSGLPRMPSNFAPKDAANPYADYTVGQLYEFLSGYQLTREIGSAYEYSNIGLGLLGHVLAQKAGTDYENLIASRVLGPLQMRNTGIKLTKEMQAQLVAGHDQKGNPAQNWDFPTLAGAGALRSTTNDLLKFLAVNMGQNQTPLISAMRSSHLARYRGEAYLVAYVGLGWQIRNREGTEIVWHTGATGGYSAFVGFSKKHNLGVVALSNTSNSGSITSAGMSLLVSLLLRSEKLSKSKK